MITNNQGIMICETCGDQVHTGMSGDRICPELKRVKFCPDLNLSYVERQKVYVEPKAAKSTRTGKTKTAHISKDDV